MAIGATRPSVEPVVVQDFSDLVPPRARVTFTVPDMPMPRPFIATCRFENRESPLNLQEYCVEQVCYGAGDTRNRFDEIKYLLEQAGF